MVHNRIDPNRTCSECGGPITLNNKSGICARTHECRSALQRRMNGGKQNGVLNGKPENSQYLLPPAYELEDEGDEYRLDANGNRIEIVDDVAIDIAVRGDRKVGLTETEREVVIMRMISGAWSVHDIAGHCGTIAPRLYPIFERLGYEVVDPKKEPGKQHMHTGRFLRKKEQVSG